jgi:hypothetical protein
MPTLAEMDADALKELIKAIMVETMAPMLAQIDGYMKPMMDADKPPAEMPAGDMAEMKAKADAEKARADALEVKLNAIEAEKRKARAATLTAALAARSIKVSGYDLARADASDIDAAERALLDHALADKPRADWGAPVQTPAAPAATTLYKI